MPRLVKRPSLEEILDFCAREPIERVFLEDVARRGLGRFAALRDGGELVAVCHLGANLVPSGEGAGAFAKIAARSRPRMLIGDERAVTDLWEAARDDLPACARTGLDSPSTSSTTSPQPAAGASRGHPSRPRRPHPHLGGGVPRGGRHRRLRPRPVALRVAHADADRGGPQLALGGGRDRPLQGRGVRLDGPHRPAPAGLGRPLLRGKGYGKRGLADLCRLLLARTPSVCLFVRPENAPAIALYDSIGMRRMGAYRSLIFE